MAESEIEAIWKAVQEFIRALQRHDPTVRRWIAPESDAALLLDLYGEEALLLLAKDYLEKERFILTRSHSPGRGRGPVRLVEIAWMGGESRPPTAEDRVTLCLRRAGRRWLVEDIFPSASDQLLTVGRARELCATPSEPASPAVLFLAGALALPLEGCGALDDVETLLVSGMGSEPFSPREVVRAVRLWRDFLQLGRPGSAKAAPYAAAVHYALSLIGRRGDTQARIAAAYAVSVASLRTRFVEIRDRLGLTRGDPRYAVLEELPAEKHKDTRARHVSRRGPRSRGAIGHQRSEDP